MELKELYLKGRKTLGRNGFECPGVEARAILSKSLGASASELYARPEKNVEREGEKTFERLLGRRLAGEPLAYITGSKEFCSRTFAVSPRVLIPRPETETLAAAAVEAVRAMKRPRVLDLGTGSGCVAVTLCVEATECEVFASDISSRALDMARANARANGASVRFVNSDLLTAFARSSFDIVVSNPPYVSEADYETLPAEIRNHEPALALLGGSDGLKYARKIAETAGRVLRRQGVLLVEVGYGQAEDVGEIFRRSGFSGIVSVKDPYGAERVVKATWKR